MLTADIKIFAFSRDGGLPLSRWVYYVDPQTRIPTHAIWFGTCWSIILGCLAFAGNNAIGAVFSLGVTGQYVSFCIPIVSEVSWRQDDQARSFPARPSGQSFKCHSLNVVDGTLESPDYCDCRHLDDFHDCRVHVPSYSLSGSRKHELYSRSPRPVSSNNFLILRVKTDFAGGVLVLATIYFYFPKYGGINWFTGPVSTVEQPAVQVKIDIVEKE